YIRGLTQTAGAINAGTDTVAQTASPAIARSLRWYANEQTSRIYVKVTGTTSTTSNYVMTLTRTAVTPTPVPTAVDAGPVYITTMNQGTPGTNTELWLYDANFNPIVGAGNDDESLAGGGTGTTTQSRLQRNLAPGTYNLAISTYSLSNNLASPADDRN